MAENETPNVDAELDETETDEEVSSGLKIRTNLKAGYGETWLPAVGGIRGTGPREPSPEINYNFNFNLYKIY